MKECLLLLKDSLEPLKNKILIYEYMTSISNSVYIHELNDIVNKYNKTRKELHSELVAIRFCD